MRNIPSEYQKVEYINNRYVYDETGTEIGLGIKTGIISGSTKVEIEFSSMWMPGQQEECFGYLFGDAVTESYSNEPLGFGVLLDDNSSDYSPRIHMPPISNYAFSFFRYKRKYKISLDGLTGELKFNDEIRHTFSDKDIYERDKGYIGIFCICDPNGEIYSYGNSAFNLYSCKIYKNNILVRDFVPCYKKSDKTVGLYDVVENNFHIGEYLNYKECWYAGPEVSDRGKDLKTFYIGNNNITKKIDNIYLGVQNNAKKIRKAYIGIDNKAKLFYSSINDYIPSFYQKIEYIENRPLTAEEKNNYDSREGGFILDIYSYDKKIEIVMAPGDNFNNLNGALFGIHTDAYDDRLNFYGIIKDNNLELLMSPPNNQPQLVPTLLNGKNTIILDGINAKAIVNNQVINFTSPHLKENHEPATHDPQIGIFGTTDFYTKGERKGTIEGGYNKLYSCKIYENEILIKNLIPCRRKSNGNLGLYDTVNQNFIEALNPSYPFKAGPDI